MSRYIKVDLTDDEILEKVQEQTNDGDTFITVGRILNSFPTADVVPVVHAYWIEHKNAEEKYNRLIPNYECSNCHTWKEEKTRFCPDCGAKMEKCIVK